MFTKAPWEVIGGYLEGNCNMGGSTTYEVPSMQDIADQTNIDEQATAGFRHNRNELGKFNLVKLDQVKRMLLKYLEMELFTLLTK